jgi:hypothetical protein
MPKQCLEITQIHQFWNDQWLGMRPTVPEALMDGTNRRGEVPARFFCKIFFNFKILGVLGF